MNKQELKEFLDVKYHQYNQFNFIQDDPVLIPHKFSKKEDIEISGFFAAMLAWGQRPVIIQKCHWLLNQMDDSPYHFLMSAGEADFQRFSGFKHRTFNGTDCIYFLKSLRRIYFEYEGLESVFTKGYKENNSIRESIEKFRELFMSFNSPERTEKHVGNIKKGSAVKRINMFLRWMVRKEGAVDFGLWKQISPAHLYMPLDVHTGNVSRKLGLLKRKQSDWKAVQELTKSLREYDYEDPVKYDFALFGLGVSEGF